MVTGNKHQARCRAECPIRFHAKCHSVSDLKYFGWHAREMCLTYFGATERKKEFKKVRGGGGRGRMSVSYRI